MVQSQNQKMVTILQRNVNFATKRSTNKS